MSRDLLLVAIALFAWGTGESAYLLFQPLYLAELGASPVSIGTILGAVGMAMTLAHIPAGYLADRFGRRIMMWGAWVLGVTAAVIMASANSLEVFTIGAITYGVTSFVSSPMNSYITAARGTWTVGRAITFTQVFYNSGAIFGPIMGGVIGNRFGYGAIYFFSTAIFIVSTITIFFIQPQPTEYQKGKSRSLDLSNKYFIRFLPILFIAYLGMYLAQPLTPNYLQDNHLLSLNKIGLLGSINNFGNVFFNLILGALTTSRGFILGQFASFIFPILVLRGTGLAWFGFAYFMLGGFHASRIIALAYIRGFITSANMGFAYGIAQTIGGFALIIAPILAGLLYEQNSGLVYQAAIFLIIFSIIISTIFNRWYLRSSK